VTEPSASPDGAPPWLRRLPIVALSFVVGGLVTSVVVAIWGNLGSPVSPGIAFAPFALGIVVGVAIGAAIIVFKVASWIALNQKQKLPSER
jgi:hypothetical protein